MLIDSVYQKDENYYPKVFLEKFIHKFFKEVSETSVFGVLKDPPVI